MCTFNLQVHYFSFSWRILLLLFCDCNYLLTLAFHVICVLQWSSSWLGRDMSAPVLLSFQTNYSKMPLELDHKEGWVPKNWCFWIVLLEKTPESPLDCKEIKPVNPKGNQPWIFTGRTVAEAEAPKLWPPDMKSQLIGNDPDVRKDWRQKEKGATEDEMLRQYYRV